MCGHVGIAGDLEFKDEKTFKCLLLQDYFRGPDSTGIARLKKNGECAIHKIASHPIDMFGTIKFKEMITGFGSSVFLGHNRYATKGAVNGYNAHPYSFGSIVGAHNGTLEKASWEELQDRLGEKYDVDSMAVIAHIDKFGIDETIPLLRGAWALVWIDLKDMTINMIRNNQRPLWYSYTKNFKKLLWSSEWEMMDAATSLQGPKIDYERYKDPEGYQFFDIKTDWHYAWKLVDLIKGSTERPKPRVKELKGKPPTPVVTHYTPGVAIRYINGVRTEVDSATGAVIKGGSKTDPFLRKTHTGTHSHGSTMTTTASATTLGANTSTAAPSEGKVVHLIGTDTDPTGGFYDKAAFDAFARYGCSWCQADVNYGDKGIVIWDDRQQVLCADCAGTDMGQTKIYCLPSKLAS